MNADVVKVNCPDCGFGNYFDKWDDLFCDKCGRDLEKEYKES